MAQPEGRPAPAATMKGVLDALDALESAVTDLHPTQSAEPIPIEMQSSAGTSGTPTPDRRRQLQRGLTDFFKMDPRRILSDFFLPGDSRGPLGYLESKGLERLPRSVEPEDAHYFGVFRPTSMEAINLMMMGRATGKALNIKGKSARRGELSGFVPFLQIAAEDEKRRISATPRDARIRVFFQSAEARDEARAALQPVLEEMLEASGAAEAALAAHERGEAELAGDDMQRACEALSWKITPPPAAAGGGSAAALIQPVDRPALGVIGLEVPARLLWEAVVARQDISHTAGGLGDTGRPSSVAFMELNLKTLREQDVSPRAVLWQFDSARPLNPRGLLMAHEEGEDGRVLPVASDMDPFLLGSKGAAVQPLSAEQLETMRWEVERIEEVLAQQGSEGWMARWLAALKSAHGPSGGRPEPPPFGFGDPTSIAVLQEAVKSMRKTGAVRHGPECYNFLFPQALDDEFLIVWEGWLAHPHSRQVPWKYVRREELYRFLCARVHDGFAFPLNPKWVLCDGWYPLWEQLLASPDAARAYECWFPRASGVRERIAAVHAAHPLGFRPDVPPGTKAETIEAGVAEWELRRYEVMQRARRKLRAIRAMTQAGLGRGLSAASTTSPS